MRCIALFRCVDIINYSPSRRSVHPKKSVLYQHMAFTPSFICFISCLYNCLLLNCTPLFTHTSFHPQKHKSSKTVYFITQKTRRLFSQLQRVLELLLQKLGGSISKSWSRFLLSTQCTRPSRIDSVASENLLRVLCIKFARCTTTDCRLQYPHCIIF